MKSKSLDKELSILNEIKNDMFDLDDPADRAYSLFEVINPLKDETEI